MHTYQEVKATHKKSLYHNQHCLILTQQGGIDPDTYVSDPQNPNHVFARLDDQTKIISLITQIAQHFQNYNLSIVGGASVYALFLPFYDTFYLTLEKNITFESGIKLFDQPLTTQKDCFIKTQRNIDDCIHIMSHYGMEIAEKKDMSPNTTLYTFKKV